MHRGALDILDRYIDWCSLCGKELDDSGMSLASNEPQTLCTECYLNNSSDEIIQDLITKKISKELDQ